MHIRYLEVKDLSLYTLHDDFGCDDISLNNFPLHSFTFTIFLS